MSRIRAWYLRTASCTALIISSEDKTKTVIWLPLLQISCWASCPLARFFFCRTTTRVFSEYVQSPLATPLLQKYYIRPKIMRDIRHHLFTLTLKSNSFISLNVIRKDDQSILALTQKLLTSSYNFIGEYAVPAFRSRPAITLEKSFYHASRQCAAPVVQSCSWSCPPLFSSQKALLTSRYS